jgi:hypothetical protein
MKTLTRRAAVLSALGIGGMTMLASDDPLADLFAPAPAGQAQAMTYRQGRLLTFNPVTLENTVLVGGSTLTNLPLLGVAEAASLGAGSIVGVVCVASDGGQTWAIIGRFVTPNTPDATDALTQVGQGIVTGFVAATESTTSVPFTDLATVGPAATVSIRTSGKALVFLGATIAVGGGVGGAAAGALWGAFVNFAAAGANTIAAGTPGGLGYSMAGVAGGGPTTEFSIARMLPLSGLNPGPTTFTAKYAIGVGNPGETASFRNRSIAVFAL